MADETGIDRGTIRAAVEDAVDTADFVSGTLRNLIKELETTVETREREVADELRSAVGDVESDVAVAVKATSGIAFALSLGRFAAEYDVPQLSQGMLWEHMNAIATNGCISTRSENLMSLLRRIDPTTPRRKSGVRLPGWDTRKSPRITYRSSTAGLIEILSN